MSKNLVSYVENMINFECTFPDECNPFQIIRYTTTHDRNKVPTNSQFTAPNPLARPTNKVPFTPISASQTGSFFLNTRCLKFYYRMIDNSMNYGISNFIL